MSCCLCVFVQFPEKLDEKAHDFDELTTTLFLVCLPVEAYFHLSNSIFYIIQSGNLSLKINVKYKAVSKIPRN